MVLNSLHTMMTYVGTSPVFALMFLLLLLIPGTHYVLASDQPGSGQEDTARISIQAAERRFQDNNLRLLASKFDIDAAKAGIAQAELWSNPNFSLGQNIHNQNTNRWFDFTSTGNTDIQIQQLFLLAGKRGKQIRLAEINSTITENAYEDLVRTLNNELHRVFYDLYFLQLSRQFYDESIPSVEKTVNATEKIYQGRAVLLSEVLRLKSLLFTLQNERLDLTDQILDKETELRVLLRDSLNIYFVPEIDQKALDTLRVDSLSETVVTQIALVHRPDLRTAQANLQSAEANLALQQSMAIPDVTLGGSWSRAGSYIPNYYALTMSIDLPLFNRNQGNIEQATAAVHSNRLLLEQSNRQIEKEVGGACKKVRATEELFQAVDKNFMGEYQQLVTGTIANYEKRNISIIEFTDFFEAYRTSMLQVYRLANNRIDALEDINYIANSKIINFPGE